MERLGINVHCIFKFVLGMSLSFSIGIIGRLLVKGSLYFKVCEVPSQQIFRYTLVTVCNITS